MSATLDEMMADYWAHLYFDDPKAAEIDEDDEFNADEVAQIISSTPPDDWEGIPL